MRDDRPVAPVSRDESPKLTGASAVIVRRAKPADAEAIERLALELQDWHVAGRPDLFKPGGCDIVAEIAARITSPGKFYWIASRGGVVVGYAFAQVVEEPETRWRLATRMLVLDQMGVTEAQRGLGVGEQLWYAVRDVAIAERVDRVMLNVWAFNHSARRFYERLGFTSFHERMALELAPDDGDPSR